MAFCNYCRGEIKNENASSCPICGCDGETMRTGSTTKEKVSHSSMPFIMIFFPVIIFIILIIAGIILTFFCGNDPDKLTTGLIIIVAIGLLSSVTYGVIYQVLHSRKIHRPNMQIVNGKVVDFHKIDSARASYFIVEPVQFEIVEFEVNGKKYRNVGKKDSGSIPAINKVVPIAYNSKNPLENYVAKDRRGILIICVAIGGVALFGALAIFIKNAFTLH